jgi:hypothetical protein
VGVSDDLSEARALLDGFVVKDLKGRLGSKHLKLGTNDEVSARQALARLLRGSGPLDRQLREQLADLLDPSSTADRTLVFAYRRRGKRADHVRTTQIAEHVFEARKTSTVEVAIADAAEKFDVSEDLAKKVWRRYRPILQAIYTPSARQSRGAK